MTTLAGDEIVPDPDVVTVHAVTIDAPPDAVKPSLVQMDWHRAGCYPARWVDRPSIPPTLPSATQIIAELQKTALGGFIPIGARVRTRLPRRTMPPI